MYKRKDDNSELCLDILHAENQMKIQNDKYDITKELIQRHMLENFNLFFNVAIGGNENESNLPKCHHNLVKKRMEMMRSIENSSQDLRHKVRDYFRGGKSLEEILSKSGM